MARKNSGDDARGKHGQESRDELLWLETYFIIFPKKRRPTLAQVEHALAAAGPNLRLENPSADDEGYFQSILVESTEDHAAVEISFATSEAIIEQNLDWAKQLQKQLTSKQLQQIVSADARLEVAHYERVEHGGARPAAGKSSPGADKPRGRGVDDFTDDEWSDSADNEFADDSFGGSFEEDYDEEAAMESFDPTCLLTVVESLASLTKGITFDPAAGEVV